MNFIDLLPIETSIDIFSFLSLQEVVSIFLLSKQYYKQFHNNSLLFYSLFKVLCKLHDINPSEILKINENNNSSEINYKQNLQFLITNYLNNRFDTTSILYYPNDNYQNIYHITNNNKTLSVKTKPLHGEFITIRGTKEFKKGNYYKTVFKVDEYKPEVTLW
ncbi:hypothetical protein ABK040_013668 [Willaertia magna]